MTASGTVDLPMYDLPEIRPATTAWRDAIAGRLGAAGLVAGPGGRPLLFQTCGYPLTHALRGRVTVVATPRYRAEGCDRASYRSAIVVRDDHPARTLAQLRGAVAAINGRDSHSGMNALRHAVAPHARDGRFFAGVEVAGAHRASLAAVRARRADVAALDCVTWALLHAHAPAETAGVRVLAWSEPAPGLPLVTDAPTDDARLDDLRAALRDPPPELLIDGFQVLPPQAYDRILEMEQEAADNGYAELR
jgi:ABC-type phosphate/phosphonate transport system substrate-binding protein